MIVRIAKLMAGCRAERRTARGRYQSAPPWLRAPPWLPALAESLGGRRFNAQGISEAVPIAELMPFKMRFTETPATDFHTRWAQWFFADRATRALAPSHSLSAGILQRTAASSRP